MNVWDLIDQLLILTGQPVTELSRAIAALFLLILSAVIVTVFLLLILDARRYATIRNPGQTKKEKEEEPLKLRAREEEEVFKPALRARWEFVTESHFKELETIKLLNNIADWRDMPDRVIEPLYEAYLAEVAKDEYVLFLEGEQGWLRFAHPDELTDSSKLGLISSLKLIWVERDYQEAIREAQEVSKTEEERIKRLEVAEEMHGRELEELGNLNTYTWGPFFRELMNRNIEEGLEFAWDSFLWKVLETVGPHRVLVKGNTLAQGLEVMRMFLLHSKGKNQVDEDYPSNLYLLTAVEFVGGRQHHVGKLMLWNSGRPVSESEVREWSERDIEVSRKRLESAMAG